ncbi:hypothetical protein VNO80_15821 [Phaseolus coccineus]|uniref:Disease resistance N-terminal domain-containing protein n=1 Tax=Phaseolus coccineus TaxID=3886 RepID=A0AAN9MLB4_PHACN
MTEVERELQSIRGEKELMEALFRDEDDIGREKLDGRRSKIWVEQVREVACEIDFLLIECNMAGLNNILECHARDTLADSSTASRFPLTTSNAVIAQKAVTNSFFLHPLQLIDYENSWILFTRKLQVDIQSKSKLQEIAEKLVTKCGWTFNQNCSLLPVL